MCGLRGLGGRQSTALVGLWNRVGWVDTAHGCRYIRETGLEALLAQAGQRLGALGVPSLAFMTSLTDVSGRLSVRASLASGQIALSQVFVGQTQLWTADVAGYKGMWRVAQGTCFPSLVVRTSTTHAQAAQASTQSLLLAAQL